MCVPPARLLLIKVSIWPFGPHFNPICIHFRGDDGTKIMIIYDLTIYNLLFFAEEREKIKEKGEKRGEILFVFPEAAGEEDEDAEDLETTHEHEERE